MDEWPLKEMTFSDYGFTISDDKVSASDTFSSNYDNSESNYIDDAAYRRLAKFNINKDGSINLLSHTALKGAGHCGIRSYAGSYDGRCSNGYWTQFLPKHIKLFNCTKFQKPAR